MKRLLALVCAAFMLLIMTGCDQKFKNSEVFFRETKWGMSMADVKDLEARLGEPKESDEEGYLEYTGQIFCTIPCSIVYFFDKEDKLYLGGYILNTEHADPADYIEDYNTVVEHFTAEFGSATSGSVSRLVPKAEGEEDLKAEDYPQAFRDRLIMYWSMWRASNTEVSVYLSNTKNIAHLVEYGDRNSDAYQKARSGR